MYHKRRTRSPCTQIMVYSLLFAKQLSELLLTDHHYGPIEFYSTERWAQFRCFYSIKCLLGHSLHDHYPHASGRDSRTHFPVGDVLAVISNLWITNTTWWLMFWLFKYTLEWTQEGLIDDKSTLVQVMPWCCQATSDYLNLCWPRSPITYDITGHNELICNDATWDPIHNELMRS